MNSRINALYRRCKIIPIACSEQRQYIQKAMWDERQGGDALIHCNVQDKVVCHLPFTTEQTQNPLCIILSICITRQILGKGSFFRNVSYYILSVYIFRSQTHAPSCINQDLCAYTHFHQLTWWQISFYQAVVFSHSELIICLQNFALSSQIVHLEPRVLITGKRA